MKLKPTIVLCFLIIGLLPVLMSIIFSGYIATISLQKDVINNLVAIKLLKHEGVLDYFNNEIKEARILANTVLSNAYYNAHFNDYQKGIDSIKDLKSLDKELNKSFDAYIKEINDLQDFLLIDNYGNIVFSYKKRQFLGENIYNKKFKGTELAREFKENPDETIIVDFSYYFKDTRPAGFILEPVIKNKKRLGYVAKLIHTDALNNIMKKPYGLGKTLETYIICSDHMLLSDLRLGNKMTADYSLKNKKVFYTDSISYVLGGKTDTLFTKDYRNVSVIESYIPIKIQNMHWGLIAKIDQDEAYLPLKQYLLWVSLITGLCLFLVVIFSLYAADYVVKPVLGIAKFIKEIAEGNYESKILKKDYKNEFGELQNASFKLRDDLKHYINEIKANKEELIIQNIDLQWHKSIIEAINKVFEETINFESENQVAYCCLKFAESLTDSPLGFIGEINSDGSMKTLAMSNAIWEQFRLSGIEKVIPLQQLPVRGYWATIIESKQSVILNNCQEISDTLSIPEGHPVINSFLGVPLYHGEKVIGMIALANRESGYKEQDKQAIEMLSAAFSEALLRVKKDKEIDNYKNNLEELVTERTEELKEAYENLKKAEERTVFYSSLLEVLNSQQYSQEIIDNIAKMIKDYLNIDAIGIRFKRGHDYPYIITDGFSEDFVAKNNYLCVYDASNNLLLDTKKRPKLECNCGSIIYKDYNSYMPYYTDGGSFWTNSTTKLLFSGDIEYLQRTTRKYCNLYGYESVALIPISFDNEVMGVLQLNHKEAEFFDLETIQFFEKVATSIGIAFKRKQLEEAIESEKNKLEITVKERTESLQESLRELEKSNKIKNKFLASLSHELRTPLNAIMGFSDLLSTKKYGDLNQRQNQYLEIIRNSTSHLYIMIKDLLDIVNIDAGNMILKYEELDINDLISEEVAQIKPVFDNKRININEIFDYSLMNIRVDRAKIKKIINNILSNSLKFTPAGGYVNIKTCLYNENLLLITIEDNGSGISEEQKPKIFEAFYKSDNKMEEDHQGMGIGLAMSKRLVELHNGSIDFESETGKGSKFYIYLPYANKAKEVTAIENNLKSYNQKNILVVEDNPSNMTLIVELLKMKNYKIACAKNGLEALETLKTFEPDLILMDIKMPVMNGLEATTKIRTMTGYINIPIIALTASVDEQSKKEQLEAGCTGILAKPIHSSDLYDLLDKFLKDDQTLI